VNSTLPTVVVADDNAAMVDAVAATLGDEFDVVETVGDGLNLIESVEHRCPDVIVVDISMPGISGIEAVRRLKQAGCTAAIVVLTVHEDPEFIDEAREAGAGAYVVKNRMTRDLAPGIRGALAGNPFTSAS
jgi:DNA-binding NarL/FixJ family response regulator